MSAQQKHDSKIWFGVILVLVGGAWLLDNLNIFPYYIEDLIFSWKTLFIGLGLFLLVVRQQVAPGIIFLSLGTIFFLQDFEILYFRNIWHLFWPAILIIIGLSIILRRRTDGQYNDPKKNSIDTIDEFTIFGGADRQIDSQNFMGGRVSAVFGGASLDLRNATLAPGNNVIDMFVMFGGVDLVVPPDWTVKTEAVAILGGFGDSRTSAIKVVPDPDKVLIVKGFVMFGGGDIKLNK